jgi:hypothetical protein
VQPFILTINYRDIYRDDYIGNCIDVYRAMRRAVRRAVCRDVRIGAYTGDCVDSIVLDKSYRDKI